MGVVRHLHPWMLIPVVTPFVVVLIRMWHPRVPKFLLPVLTPFIGIVLDYALEMLDYSDLSFKWAAILGASGVMIREAYNQALKSLDRRKKLQEDAWARFDDENPEI